MSGPGKKLGAPWTCARVAMAVLLGCGVAFAQEPAETGETTTLEEETTFSLDGPSYLITSENIFGTPELGWTGFLTGMRATTNMHQRFADPLGNPIYFESPFIETSLRALYLWHDFPHDSQLTGGELSAWAAQVRIAVTDRLAIIAPKDGYTHLKGGIVPDGDGWNDFMVGLKYAFIVDEANEFVLTSGLRWEWHNGNRDVLMGGDSGANELSPFVSFAKGWDRFHFIGDLGFRLPMDRHDGNHIAYWDLHFDYEVAPETLPGFFPLLEIHALHYLSDADALPLNVGGLDYTNLGSNNVAGTSVFWGDLGFRWKLSPNMSFGAAYGFPISSPGNDIFNQRFTFDVILSF